MRIGRFLVRLVVKTTRSTAMAFRALNSCSRAQLKVGSRYYSSATTGFVKPAFIDVPRPVLGEYRADVPASVGPKNTPRVAKVTTLANGLRVASLTSSDIAASVGLFVGIGTRNETRSNAGATHFLKYSAFGSNTDMPGYQVVREFETIGASVQASAGREQLAFSAEFPPNKVDEVVPLIRGLLHPKFAYHEVTAQVEVVREDAERLEADPIASIFELVHRQAYRNRGLGQSLVATKDNLHHINQEVISKFVDTHYGLDQSVFVGVGFEHEALVKHVEGAFGVKETRKTEITKEASKYVGGEVTVPAGGHTHIVLAFEGASNKGDAKDALALGVLQHVLGSVLNGNVPTQVGSGVTSRLAKLIPNNNAVHTLTAFNFSGLFGVYAETHDAPSRLVQNISAELNKLRNNLSAEELAKGKAGFKLAVLEKGSQRTPALEFIASQVFASGKAVTPEEYAAQIDSITAEDVARVAKKVFSSRPTFVAVGDVAQLPTAEDIASAVNPKQ